jgi:thioesterase domain-containing protein
MAQQLRAAGQPVAFLGLIESRRPSALTSWWVARGRRIRRRVRFEVANVRALTGRERRRYLAERSEKVAGVVARGAARLLGREAVLDREIRGMQARHLAALRRYVPRIYPGRLDLFHPAKTDADLGWTHLAGGGMHVHDVPAAGHVNPNMFGEARVRLLAERLRACLDEAHGARCRR